MKQSNLIFALLCFGCSSPSSPPEKHADKNPITADGQKKEEELGQHQQGAQKSAGAYKEEEQGGQQEDDVTAPHENGQKKEEGGRGEPLAEGNASMPETKVQKEPVRNLKKDKEKAKTTPPDKSGDMAKDKNNADNGRRIVARPPRVPLVNKVKEEETHRKGVEQRLRSRGKFFRQCYTTALEKNAKLKGKLIVEFIVMENGKVGDATVRRNKLGSPAVAECVLGGLKRMRFPKPYEGNVRISHTFNFLP